MKPLYIPEETIEKPVEEAKKEKKWEHFTPSFVGTQAQTLDLGVLERQMKLSQKLYCQARIGQAEGRAVFQTTRPIVIFFIGDVHWGSIFTDHERFHREIEGIKSTPGAFLVWT